MMTRGEELLLDAIGAVRQRTITLYAELAALVDAASLGWRVRAPGEPDVTLELLRKAILEAPILVARPLLLRIAANDEEIARLTRALVDGEEVAA